MHKKIKKVLISIPVFYLLAMLFYRHVEGWSWIDSFYFVGTTMNALGHSEFFAVTDIGKVFTVFLSTVGIILVFYVVGALLDGVSDKKN